ncbi:hypothetical protein QBC45DRAFT_434958 [Copromyces sp. CBS 386.78]|nr:hypothetical protein QBC45DRAFT_434958 [Copromyces sp. CBS 386.78]
MENVPEAEMEAGGGEGEKGDLPFNVLSPARVYKPGCFGRSTSEQVASPHYENEKPLEGLILAPPKLVIAAYSTWIKAPSRVTYVLSESLTEQPDTKHRTELQTKSLSMDKEARLSSADHHRLYHPPTTQRSGLQSPDGPGDGDDNNTHPNLETSRSSLETPSRVLAWFPWSGGFWGLQQRRGGNSFIPFWSVGATVKQQPALIFQLDTQSSARAR